MTSETTPAPAPELLSVAMVTLGCARNEVDSEELAGRLEADGFLLVDDPADADTVVVNTCGFVESAKKDSVDTLLAAADLKETGRPQAVVAVGCMAERYGKELAESLPEADAVLGFDDYPDIAARLRSIVAGEAHHAHTPQDRRRLLPISPVERPLSTAAVPGHASGPASLRRRLDPGPTAVAQAGQRLRPALLVLRDPVLPRLVRQPAPQRRAAGGAVAGRRRACASCSSSARTPRPTARTSATCGCSRRCCPSWPPSTASSGSGSPTCSPPRPGPGLVEAIATTPGVTPYFDLSFQHASGPLLRRMRRFGDPESFLGLLEQIRGSRRRPASAAT